MNGVLDFLSPSRASDERGFHPVARSAIEPLFAAAEASFEERDGWRVAVAVPGEEDVIRAVGLADLSHLGKLEVRPAPASPAAYRLSPRRALLFFAELARAQVVSGLPEGTSALDVTAAYSVLAVSGPEARTLIARLTHLHHFPSGGEVAHVTAHVLPAGAGFRLVVAQELGLYLTEVALDCARALGGGLVGVDALPEEGRA
jgi:glycine cleavage system aminomethyltransferase T